MGYKTRKNADFSYLEADIMWTYTNLKQLISVFPEHETVN